MKNRVLLKVLLLLLFCVINSFSQSSSASKVDSLIVVIKKNIDNNELETAQFLIDELRNIDTNNPEFHKAKVGYCQSEIHVANNDDEQALKVLLEGFTTLQNYNSSLLYSKYAETIGRIFGRTRNYSRAIEYFNLGLKNSLTRNDSLTISSFYLNLGSINQMQQKIDSVSYYYDKVMEFSPKLKNNEETLATAYSNLIGVVIAYGDFDLAEEYGNKSFEIYEKRNDTLKMAGILSNLGSIKMYTRDLDKSNEYYFKTLDLLNKRTDIKSREIIALTFDNISQIFYLKEEYQKGYDYLFESVLVEKQFMAEKLENRITEIEAMYDVSVEEKHTGIEKNRRQRAEFWTYVLSGAIFILLGFLWLFYRTNNLKRQKFTLEYEKEKMAQMRKMELVQSDAQIKILNATLDGKEAERRHIAEILHDNVSTLLSSANMHLYAVKVELAENAPEEIDKIEVIISEASDKIRDLSHKLISSVLLKFGIASAVEDLCEKYSNSQLKFNPSIKNIGRYDQSFEIKIHNIIEELVNNILKHSNADTATIKLEQTDGNLQIRVFDNGHGFNIDEVIKKDGLGLSQITARIKMMKGIFDVKSSKKTGTRIFMNIPIPD